MLSGTKHITIYEKRKDSYYWPWLCRPALAIEFGKVYQTIGFDTNTSRVDELLNGIDTTKEVTLQELKESIHLSYTNNEKDIQDCNIYIITVPTPIDNLDNPNLKPSNKSK